MVISGWRKLLRTHDGCEWWCWCMVVLVHGGGSGGGGGEVGADV